MLQWRARTAILPKYNGKTASLFVFAPCNNGNTMSMLPLHGMTTGISLCCSLTISGCPLRWSSATCYVCVVAMNCEYVHYSRFAWSSVWSGNKKRLALKILSLFLSLCVCVCVQCLYVFHGVCVCVRLSVCLCVRVFVCV